MQSAADAEAAAIADQELAEGDLGERTVRVDAEAERLDALLDALRHYLASVRNAASAAAELGQVVADEGFADAATAAAALIPPEEASERAAAIADFDARMAAVTARLGTEAMARASELSRVDPTALGEAVRGAQSEAQRCRELLGAVSRAFQGASDAAVSLAEIAGEVDRQRAAHQPLARMRAVASGDNALSMTLPTYVLLERFDEVLELANQRLIAMTDGRYELERADDHEGRTHRQGLGLHMIDHEAGDVRRATRTLSGGETFVTSLALALGLSDAVTTAAGGIELGTLLVDEGFGSLDGENLDRVMTQFAALRSDGRQVGVISHVEELKSRIHDRITVRALGDGTSTLECPVPGVLFEVSR
jgi:exonuclease SbcC